MWYLQLLRVSSPWQQLLNAIEPKVNDHFDSPVAEGYYKYHKYGIAIKYIENFLYENLPKIA